MDGTVVAVGEPLLGKDLQTDAFERAPQWLKDVDEPSDNGEPQRE